LAGNDINDCVSVVEKQGINRNHDAPAFIDALREFTKPIIAAVDGFAVGIGVTLLLYCDLVYATKEAKSRTPLTHLGLCPEASASNILPKMMGHARAAEWLLLGEIMTAEQAQIDGVVTRVTDAPLMLALEKVKVFSTMSPTALRETKRLMTFDNETLCKMLEEKMKVFSTCLESEEAREAFKKFLKK
jgi:enoyl-CoA hydratase/carnithine racemase